MTISLNSQFSIAVKMILFLLIKNVICWKVIAGSFKLVQFPSFRSSRSALAIIAVALHKLLKLQLDLLQTNEYILILLDPLLTLKFSILLSLPDDDFWWCAS